ncbi:hypothetical protein [Nonomuraea jabiensis]|uniref:hypothetical protein n=1 Tax=Nonomuraea jabiensis TaxID=882448 RepID=UPI0036A2AC6D
MAKGDRVHGATRGRWAGNALERPAPAPRQPLTPQRIATAAVGIADAEGLDALTPRRMAVTERSPSALAGSGLDPDTTMSVFRALDAYANSAMAYEIAVRSFMDQQGRADGGELRSELAPQMTWHIQTGRHPAFEGYLMTVTRKDDVLWRFEYVLDGIAAKLGI